MDSIKAVLSEGGFALECNEVLSKVNPKLLYRLPSFTKKVEDVCFHIKHGTINDVFIFLDCDIHIAVVLSQNLPRYSCTYNIIIKYVMPLILQNSLAQGTEDINTIDKIIEVMDECDWTSSL